jgi:nicotinamidase-related amidase
MKSFILSIVFLAAFQYAAAQSEYALLVIDVQNFYFPGGRSELVEPEKAAEKAAVAILAARETGNPIIYIQHKSSAGMEIHDIVKPAEGEKIFVKEEVNSFLGTGLKEYIDALGIDTLVICGMQTQMCVEAAVRAAHDFGYSVILLHDACATRNLKFGDREVTAADVHASTLATLKSYGTILSVAEWTAKEQGMRNR